MAAAEMLTLKPHVVATIHLLYCLVKQLCISIKFWFADAVFLFSCRQLCVILKLIPKRNPLTEKSRISVDSFRSKTCFVNASRHLSCLKNHVKVGGWYWITGMIDSKIRQNTCVKERKAHKAVKLQGAEVVDEVDEWKNHPKRWTVHKRGEEVSRQGGVGGAK